MAVSNGTVTVRATSNDGIDGQSLIQIYAVGYGDDDTGIHTVENGETMESIAEDYGSTPEELTELNPEIGPGGPAPDDDLIVPDTEPFVDESPAPGGEAGDPPSVDPGSPLVDFPFSIVEMINFGGDAMVDLRLEVTALRTWEDYERLHCYVGVAGELPQWYPDQDRNQATGETFEKLGRGWWSTEETMQGNEASLDMADESTVFYKFDESSGVSTAVLSCLNPCPHAHRKDVRYVQHFLPSNS